MDDLGLFAFHVIVECNAAGFQFLDSRLQVLHLKSDRQRMTLKKNAGFKAFS